MALKTVGQSTHPQLKKLFQDFAKDLFGYVPKGRNNTPKNSTATRYRVRRQFDFRKPDRSPIIMPFLIFLALMFMISWLMHYFLQDGTKQLENGGLGNSGDALTKQNILFVVAHPDDESMFFAPSVVRLADSDKRVHLLSLTTGNFYGKGETRKNELKSSARILGLSISNVHVVDDSAIQDSDQKWDVGKVSAVIQGFVERHDIQLIVTFDEYGVSGHINHRSVYYAVRKLISKSSFQSVLAYKLESTNVIRKYSWLLDLPYSWWSCDRCLLFISTWAEVTKAQEAMRAHASQYVWFRKLYIRVSRYMIINTLKPINAIDDQNAKHSKTL